MHNGTIFAWSENVDEIFMDRVIHRSGSRGFSDNGWLKSYFTFSFANYYDPRRINFGAIRVLNEDAIEGGEGFSSHPHDNMEIVIIPTHGSLDHGDNIGNITTVGTGEAQIISAGTGIIHNTYNHSDREELRYIQLWIFPREYELPPSYSKVTLSETVLNHWQPVVSPQGGENVLPINQNAWVHMAEVGAGASIRYTMNDTTNGLYLFVMNGDLFVADSTLHEGDAVGLTHLDYADIEAETACKILAMEVPMRRWSASAEQ